MRTLILSDPHHKIDKVEQIMNATTWDQVVGLGDWLDDWGDTPAIAKRTTEWLVKHLQEPWFRTVLGNHDAMYFYPMIQGLICSGGTLEKMIAVTDILKTAPRRITQKIPLHLWIDGWLISHAGIHPWYLPRPEDEVDMTVQEWIDELGATTMMDLSLGRMNNLVGAGADRGGWQAFGGINWLDWINFEPIPGLNQLVGHTQAKDVRIKTGQNSLNYCIDTRMRHYGMIEDGSVLIFSADDIYRKAATTYSVPRNLPEPFHPVPGL